MVAECSRALRVCIDADVDPVTHGGVAQVVLGLVKGLAELGPGSEHYYFAIRQDRAAMLRPLLGDNCHILPLPTQRARSRIRQLASRSSLIRRSWQQASELLPLPDIPVSSGLFEASGADVLHFPTQSGFVTGLPTVYQPHDLQHLHLPQYFTDRQRRFREKTYRTLCEQAGCVAVVSSWVKNDLVDHYGLDPRRIAVVPYGPAAHSYAVPGAAEVATLRCRLQLPSRFLLYPAQTWPHKNHVGLLHAIAKLRDCGREVPLVCTGMRNDYFRTLEGIIRALALEKLVTFLDFVAPLDLRMLYTLADIVVMPSKFEAASFPLWEAFAAGTAATCSNVTSLPLQAGDAALLFDPEDSSSIATAIDRLWGDADLRRMLAERGKLRVREFTWQRCARHFRAIYRRLGGRELTDEDRTMLDGPPLM